MKIIHNPKHKIISFLDERFYTNDSTTFYPGATTILEVYPKGYGFNEYLKRNGVNADQILKEAGEQGTKIHDAIERYINGEKIIWINEENKENYTFEEWKMIYRAVEFFNIYKPEVISTEVSFLDEDLGYGGTIDLVCKIKGEIWLIDYKSSNYIWKTHELQLAAYVALWNKNYPDLKIKRHGILHLKAQTRGENGKRIQGKGWQLKEFDREWREAYKVFAHTKNIWYEENPNYAPKNEEYPDFFELKTLEDKKKK